MMKIVFRADGGNTIGMGHIMRTIVLAKELAKTNEVFFVCRYSEKNKNKYASGITKLQEEGFNLIKISEEKNISELIQVKADMLITDSYDVDENYFEITKKYFNKTVYIDDMNLYRFNLDYIINQNLGAEKFKYITNKDCKLLLGSKYTMLRDEFRNIENKKVNQKVKDVLVTMGGADPNNVTKGLLECLTNKKYKLHVIIGPSYTNKEDLKNCYGELGNVVLYENAVMSKVMCKCDVAISSCSSTVYEIASLGIPLIGIVTAQNQEAIARMMNEYGILINMGWFNKLDKNFFNLEFKNICNNTKFRNLMIMKQRRSIDKFGVNNIIKQLIG